MQKLQNTENSDILIVITVITIIIIILLTCHMRQNKDTELAAKLRGSRPGVQSALLNMTSLMTS